MHDAFVYALGVAISPIPIATVLLILSSRGATANATSFAAGWILGLAISAVAFALLVDRLDVTNSKPLWIGVTELVLGAAFLVVAARLWLGRRHGRSSASRLEALDRLTPTGSATLAVVLSGANPKVLALSLGAALSLARTGADLSVAAGAIALYVAIGAAGVVVPTVAYLAFPARGEAWLGRLRAWLARHERVVLIVLALAIGGVFLRDGLVSLAS